MKPATIIAKLTPLIEDGKLLNVYRESSATNKQQPIYLRDFDHGLAHVTYTTQKDGEVQMLEGWEDPSDWVTIMVVRSVSAEELLIEAQRELKIMQNTPSIGEEIARAFRGNTDNIKFS